MTPGEIGFALAGLVVGATVGVWGTLKSHNLAITRDKRKEWNEAAQPIRGFLIKQGGKPSPFTPMPDVIEIQLMADMLTRPQRDSFFEAWDRYKDAHKTAQIQDSMGGVSYSNEGIVEVRKCVNVLLTHIQRL